MRSALHYERDEGLPPKKAAGTIGAANLLGHWQLTLLAGVLGLCAGLVLCAGIYIAPLVRLRLAPPEDREGVGRRLLSERRAAQRGMEDLLAVYEEHAHPETAAFRHDVGLHARALRRLELEAAGRGAR